MRLQGVMTAERREATHGYGLKEAAILGGGVGASAHAMRCCQAFSSKRFRPDAADTEAMQCSVLVEADGLVHNHLFIIRQCVIISNLQLRNVVIAAVVEELNAKKTLFGDFNVNQILPCCSQLTLLSVCTEFQTFLFTVIKQDIKLSIDSIAVS